MVDALHIRFKELNSLFWNVQDEILKIPTKSEYQLTLVKIIKFYNVILLY